MRTSELSGRCLLLLCTLAAWACTNGETRTLPTPAPSPTPSASGVVRAAEEPAFDSTATGTASASSRSCVPDGGFDDVLERWSCCSGVVVPGTVVCLRAEDHGTTWDSCLQICGSRLVGGCVPAGGFDDVDESTSCCNRRAVPGSARCLNPADFGTSWRSCVQICA